MGRGGMGMGGGNRRRGPAGPYFDPKAGQPAPSGKRLQHIRSLTPRLARHRVSYFFGALSVIGSTITMSVAPILIKYIVDTLVESRNTSSIYYGVAAIVGLSVIGGVFLFFQRMTLIVTSRKVEYELRRDIYRKLVSLDPSVYARWHTGDLMARASNDIDAVRGWLGPGIMQTFSTALIMGMSVSIMVSINPRLTLLTLAPLPILVFLVSRFGRKLHSIFEKVQEQYSRLTEFAQENLSGVRVVKAFVREDSQQEQFETLNRENIKRNMEAVKVQGVFQALMTIFSGVGMALTIFFGAREVMLDRMGIGSYVAFNMYLMMLTWPMIGIGWVVTLLQRGEASMGRINQLLALTPELTVLAPSSVPQRYDLEVEHVSFRYADDSPWTLRDISFRIPEGETHAVVGRVGSGKSSLVTLLARLYDPQEGTVRMGGVDLRAVPLNELRHLVGLVPQETFLFSDTIRYNIAFGENDPLPGQLERAVETAQLGATMKDFPQGLDTIIGERGITLSGGQKQRVAIARALIDDPPILLFDDCLSAVDTETEREILGGLNRVLERRTALIISHRINAVRNASRIYVLDEGKIVESGSHEELVAKEGLYAQINRRQLLQESLEESEK